MAIGVTLIPLEPQPSGATFNTDVSLSVVFTETYTTGFDHREALRHSQFDSTHDTPRKKGPPTHPGITSLPVDSCHVSSLAHGPELCTGHTLHLVSDLQH